MPITQSIAFRLTLAVFLSVVLALLGLGLITNHRLMKGLDEQAIALEQLSENMLQERLKGDTALVRNQLEDFAVSLESLAREFSRRPALVQAVASGNDVTVNERLKNLNQEQSFDLLLAFNEKGLLLGTTTQSALVETMAKLKNSSLHQNIIAIANENNRAKPMVMLERGELPAPLLQALGLSTKINMSYLMVYPVFDDFGETIGAILALRQLKINEPAISRFAKLADVEVLLQKDNAVLTRTDKDTQINLDHETHNGLTKTQDGQFIAHCEALKGDFKLCVGLSRSVLQEMRAKMLTIGQEQMFKIRQLVTIAGIWTMLVLTFILFIIINGTIRGLSTLNQAAQDVAEGRLETQFKPLGVGEINMLSLSFDKMLRHLRGYTQKIHQLAFYDEVTGLANRTKLLEEIEKNLHSEAKNVLLMVDIANFKGINDTYGLKAGDKLLKKIAERLTHVLRFYTEYEAISAVTVSRLNGANFVAHFLSPAQDEALQDLCTIVASHLGKTVKIGSSSLNTSHPIGIYTYQKGDKSPEVLISHLQLALEEAKKRGRQAAVFFDPKMQEAASHRQEIEIELKEALAKRDLKVYYQPKVNCEDGKINAAEALVRWIHPRLGFISPGTFIPIAEEAGLIGEVGRFVLERAIQETKMLLEKGHEICTSVNVSALQLEDASFAQEVLNLLAYYDLPARCLELEITESLAMRDIKGVNERITLLRSSGIKFSMDDFGTGYSNLSQLAKMPIDVLKLDRSLIQDVHLHPNKQVLAKTILNLAKELQFKTVVEGVEKHEELSFCLHHGATSVQGFIFSPAVPIEKFMPLLAPADLKRVFSDIFDKMGGPRQTWALPPLKLSA